MITEQSRTWNGQTAGAKARRRPRVQLRAPSFPRVEVHPIAWLRGYPLLLPVILISLAMLMYMLQANQGNAYDSQLQALQAQHENDSGLLAGYATHYDSLTSCSRVCPLAATKLGMVPANLTSALWIKVPVPHSVPRLPVQVQIQTGPLPWLEHAVTAIRKSL